MKPNYEAMSKAELKTYVLEHRDDLETIWLLFQIPEGLDVKRYPPVSTEQGIPIEENIRIMEQAIRENIEQENKKNTLRPLLLLAFLFIIMPLIII